MKSTKKIIAIDKLHAFENHPYKVQDNEEMEALVESIKEHGIVSPVIV
ncbi:MAG: ParB N-terminal domain-containing protein, partial [Clostridia bacterium]|nr:ParB N-terminal domain-containing protein [Clostridia bacterium]